MTFTPVLSFVLVAATVLVAFVIFAIWSINEIARDVDDHERNDGEDR